MSDTNQVVIVLVVFIDRWNQENKNRGVVWFTSLPKAKSIPSPTSMAVQHRWDAN